MLRWVLTHEIRTGSSSAVTTRDVLSQTDGHLIFNFDQYQSSYLIYIEIDHFCVRSGVLQCEMGLRS